jgi:hypothetical protein
MLVQDSQWVIVLRVRSFIIPSFNSDVMLSTYIGLGSKNSTVHKLDMALILKALTFQW